MQKKQKHSQTRILRHEFDTVWDGKIKIALIIGISVLVGVYYNHSTNELYDNSVIIKPSKNSQFTKFQKIDLLLYY